MLPKNWNNINAIRSALIVARLGTPGDDLRRGNQYPFGKSNAELNFETLW